MSRGPATALASADPSVLVVAKASTPGRVKTRLVPPLTPEQALSLHEALLLDTLEGCKAEASQVLLLHADPSGAERLAALVGPKTELLLQGGRGLGDALRLALRGKRLRGTTALVSGDVPGVPPGALTKAFSALRSGADVVLGPALDGGYWLIAMNAYHEAPFRDIPWSTPAVLATTYARCEEAGLSVATVEPWRDVDTLVDLAALLRDAATLPGARTRRLVRELERVGAIGVLPETRLIESRLLLASPWRAVIQDRLALPGAGEVDYTYLSTPRAVFVVPVTADGELVLVRQYRHPVRDWTIEVPAGAVIDGETALEAARRELLEEVGGTTESWRHLATFYSSSAHLSLRSDAFLAQDVALGEASPGRDEAIVVVRMPVEEALARARSGGFAEGQTALSILLAAVQLER